MKYSLEARVPFAQPELLNLSRSLNPNDSLDKKYLRRVASRYLSPELAGRNDNLVAINATLQIDLLGQCGSESLGFSPYSGTGGQSDFVRAANRSRGGKAFIVLPSTAKDDSISRIVPTLSPGTHVSTSKNDINYVVTEFGVAQLRGKSAKQRAREMIGIAHPDFRAELTEQAKRMNLA